MLYRVLDAKVIPMRGASYDGLKLFFICMVVFAGALAVGGIFSKYLFEPAYYLFINPVMVSVGKINSLFGSGMVLAAAIFLKNLIAVFFSVAIARRTRGVSIALLLVLNGMIIGSFLSELHAMGSTPLFLLAGLMTHGIFEFTGVFIGAALGLKLLLVSDGQLNSCRSKVFSLVLKVVVPILILAALTEVYATPFILMEL